MRDYITEALFKNSCTQLDEWDVRDSRYKAVRLLTKARNGRAIFRTKHAADKAEARTNMVISNILFGRYMKDWDEVLIEMVNNAISPASVTKITQTLKQEIESGVSDDPKVMILVTYFCKVITPEGPHFVEQAAAIECSYVNIDGYNRSNFKNDSVFKQRIEDNSGYVTGKDGKAELRISRSALTGINFKDWTYVVRGYGAQYVPFVSLKPSFYKRPFDMRFEVPKSEFEVTPEEHENLKEFERNRPKASKYYFI